MWRLAIREKNWNPVSAVTSYRENCYLVFLALKNLGHHEVYLGIALVWIAHAQISNLGLVELQFFLMILCPFKAKSFSKWMLYFCEEAWEEWNGKIIHILHKQATGELYIIQISRQDLQNKKDSQ